MNIRSFDAAGRRDIPVPTTPIAFPALFETNARCVGQHGVRVCYGRVADHRAVCRHSQAMIGFLAEGVSGEIQFARDRSIVSPFSGALCFVAPGASYVGSWDHAGLVLALLIEPEVLRGALTCDYGVIADDATVAEANDYVPHLPGVRDSVDALWRRMSSPADCVGDDNVTTGAAFYAGIFLWQWRAWHLRIRRDGEDPEVVLAQSWLAGRNVEFN